MLIYLNKKPVDAPWGGGDKTVRALVDELERRGHSVVHTFVEGIDRLVCFDPRSNHEGVGWDLIVAYRNRFKVPIIQRVGDLGTHGKPELLELLKRSIPCSDRVVFPSKWARAYVDKNIDFLRSESHVVLNGAHPSFFDRRILGRLSSVPRLVTHHWSTNPRKGFAVYEKIARNEKISRSERTFTYYGRLPEQSSLKSSGVLNVEELAVALPKCDIYVTASEEEAGANHVLEAMAAGLPVVYHALGGSIREYVGNAGVSFTGDAFDSAEYAIEEAIERWNELRERALSFKRTTLDCARELADVICK